jgi:uncharacterized coiled-coil protein SlyX
MKHNPKTTTLLIVALLACFGLVEAQATDAGSVLPNGNTADGSGVLINLTTGLNNSGFGFQALTQNTSGNNNTADGFRALRNNTTGKDNTATGAQALFSNTIINGISGSGNTGTGSQALKSNTTGSFNTATGYHALLKNNGGNFNTANGHQALASNTTGTGNTATGVNALVFSTTSAHNTAYGDSALYSNTNGDSNTATGYLALYTNKSGRLNTAVGETALYSAKGTQNIGIGTGAGANIGLGNGNICLGHTGITGDNNTMRLGIDNGYVTTRTFITGVYDVNEGGTIAAVYINSAGQLGTQPPSSSRRFKHGIEPIGDVSEAVLCLNPVSFRYNGDAKATPQFGLIAEEVAKINPDLVLRDEHNEIYTVRYDAVNAMLLNEFLKEHRNVAEQQIKVAAQQSTIAELKTTVAQQQKQIEALIATVRKVSDRVELSAPAPRIAANED